MILCGVKYEMQWFIEKKKWTREIDGINFLKNFVSMKKVISNLFRLFAIFQAS